MKYFAAVLVAGCLLFAGCTKTDTGATASSGSTGNTGFAATSGSSGSTGSAGSSGNTGTSGSTGSTGTTGSTGNTASGPGGCTPLTDGGNCYEPGEFCRNSDHGATGVAGNGTPITCQNNDGWRWEPS